MQVFACVILFYWMPNIVNVVLLSGEVSSVSLKMLDCVLMGSEVSPCDQFDSSKAYFIYLFIYLFLYVYRYLLIDYGEGVVRRLYFRASLSPLLRH